jgi:hypothetical protein
MAREDRHGDRLPDDPNVLYNLGMCYIEFHELDIAIDT